MSERPDVRRFFRDLAVGPDHLGGRRGVLRNAVRRAVRMAAVPGVQGTPDDAGLRAAVASLEVETQALTDEVRRLEERLSRLEARQA